MISFASGLIAVPSRVGALNGSCTIRVRSRSAAGRNALGLLQRKTAEIPAAHELSHRCGALGIEAERFKRLPAKHQRRLVGFTHLEIDALGEQLQAVTAIEGPHVKPHARKFGMDKIDDAARVLAIVDADRDEPGFGGAGCAQDIEASAVAVIDPETETRGLLDHLRIVVDDRHVDAFGEQALRGDLAESAQADDQHRPVRVGEIVGLLLGGPGKSPQQLFR